MKNGEVKMEFRNPYDVAIQMRNAIPEEKHAIRSVIEKFTSDFFMAPEVIFQLLSELVNKVIPFPPQEEWQWNVVCILMNNSRRNLENDFKDTMRLAKIREKNKKTK